MGRSRIASKPRISHFLASFEETFSFAKEFAITLQKPAVLALEGDLGAGKTSFIQGLAKGLSIEDPIQSPTFTILNLYEGLAHFDLYRLKKEEDFTALGFEEYFFSVPVCAIEWPSKIKTLLPEDAIFIRLEYEEEGRRIFIS